MQTIKSVVQGALLFLCFAYVPANAVVIDFTTPEVVADQLSSSFTTQGFTFSISNIPENINPVYYYGTDSDPTQFAFCPGCVLTVTSADASPFSFNSLYILNFPSDYSLEIRGTQDGGSDLAEVHQAAGQTVNFGWDSLTSLTLTNLTGDPTVITNLTFNAVPVPAAAWLLGSGIAFLGWFRRSKSEP